MPANSGLITSSLNQFAALLALHGQQVAITAQYVSLKLDPCGTLSLKYVAAGRHHGIA
jgi:hypothetical protein